VTHGIESKIADPRGHRTFAAPLGTVSYLPVDYLALALGISRSVKAPSMIFAPAICVPFFSSPYLLSDSIHVFVIRQAAFSFPPLSLFHELFFLSCLIPFDGSAETP
jgi:hypothetical protein